MSAAELSLVLAALQQTPALRPDGRSLQSVRPLRLASRIVAAAAGSCEAERAGTVARAVVSAEVTEGEPAWNVAVDVPAHLENQSLAHLVRSMLLPVLPAPPAPLQPASKTRRALSWTLSLDVSLRSVQGGNAADALLAAAFGAVASAELPATRPVGTSAATAPAAAGSGATGDKMGLEQGLVGFELAEGSVPLKGREEWPAAVTVALLPNGTHLLDPSPLEEAALPPHVRVLVLASSTGRIRGARLLAEPESSMDEGEEGAATWGALGPERVRQGIRLGTQYAQQLHAALFTQLEEVSQS